MPDDLASTENAKAVIKFVSQECIINNEKKNLLNGYMKCIKVLGLHVEQCEKLIEDYKKTINIGPTFVKPTETEKQNKISIDEVVIRREELKRKITAKFGKNDVEYLALCLYSYMPSLRSEDWINTYCYEDAKELYIDNPENKNFLCLTKKQMILNTYKTAKTHGQRILDIPVELNEIIRQFKIKSESDYVICTSQHNQYIQEGFSRTQSLKYSKFSKLLHTDDNNIEALKEQRDVLAKLLADVDAKILKLQ